MRNLFTPGFASALACAIVLVQGDAAVAQYTFTTLDFPGAARTFARALNDTDQVVGWYYVNQSDTAAHGFILSGGTYTTVDYPGAADTGLRGINGAGDAVGVYLTSFVPNGYGAAHSFLYSGGTITPLPDVPGSSPGTTFAEGINSSGQIVGWYLDACFCRARGFLLSGGQFTTIDVPGFNSSAAMGINDAGQIVGVAQQSWGGGAARGYLLSGGQFTTIIHPQMSSGGSTQAMGIGNSGLISGTYDGPQTHGFVLNGSTYSTVDVAQASSMRVEMRVNNKGRLVGGFTDTSGHDHGFLAFVEGPSASAGPPQVLTSNNIGQATVTLTGVGTSPANLPLTYAWSNGVTTIGTTPAITLTLGLGAYTFTFTVTDSFGNSASATTQVTVQLPTIAGPPGPQGEVGPQGPTGPQGPSAPQVWSTFVNGFDQTFKAATFTPDSAIVVTRIEVQLATPPAGCSVDPRIKLTDGTTETVLTLHQANSDSGPLSLNYQAGAPLMMRVSRAASCAGGTSPAAGNIVVQYRAQ